MTLHRLRSALGPSMAVVTLSVLLAACGTGGAPATTAGGAPATTAGGAPATTGSTGPGAPATPGAEKPPLTGLLDMGVQAAYQDGQPFPTTDPSTLDPYAGAFNGIVVNESWSQLEPSPGVEQWAPLDQSLAAVQAWNAQHPTTPLGVKLRIFAGYGAPQWVVAESGPPVTIVTGKSRHQTKTLGRWWTTTFRQAWSTFQHALAARYDTNPLVRQVSVSSCSSSTGEPFVVSGAVVSQRALAAAGWTVQLQERCLAGALADYSGWVHTPVTFAFNQIPSPNGSNAGFTDQLMRACAGSKAAGGPQCVLGNNDLSANATAGKYSASVYTEIATLTAGPNPPTVYFQTVGAPVTCSTLQVAISHHAGSVELWPPQGALQGFAAIPVATLTAWNRALASGSPITC